MGIGTLHTISNYFTVALVTLGIVFELVGRRRQNEGAMNYGWNSLRLGFVFVLLSLLSGLVTESSHHIDSAASLSEMFHKTVSVVFAVFVLVVILFRLAFAKKINSTEGGAGFRGAYLTLQLASICLLLVTLFLGTRLVRTYGVGVEPVEKMNELPATPPPPASTIPKDSTHYSP